MLVDELDLYLTPEELDRFSNRSKKRLEYLEQCKLFIDIVRSHLSADGIFLLVENKEFTLKAGGKLITGELFNV